MTRWALLALLAVTSGYAGGCTEKIPYTPPGGGGLELPFANQDSGFPVFNDNGFPVAGDTGLLPDPGGTDPGWATPDPGWATPDPGWTTPDPGWTTPDPGWTTPDPGWTTPDPGWWTPDPGWWTPDPGPPDAGPPDPGSPDTWALEDWDGDGITNGAEGDWDADQDGLMNWEDPDSDSDGIFDSAESGGVDPPVDSDGDGTPDFVDVDSDNDGLLDQEEAVGADGIPNSGDETDTTSADSDGDGFTDLVEVAYGSDANDPSSQLPPEVFYVILPYEEDHVYQDLEFGTDISYADILVMVDLSGSMLDEHNNLKAGINNVIIQGVQQQIPNAAFGLVKFGTWQDDTYQLTQSITTNAAAVQSAVNTINDCGGADEAHAEALYQAATGVGFNDKYCDLWFLGCLDWVSVNIPPASCPAGTLGGACFRDIALPIFIMITDEDFTGGGGLDWDDNDWHTTSQAINAMNNIGAKFIGVDSSSGNYAASDFQQIANGVNGGQAFNFTIASNGTGLSSTIVDAVFDLTQNIQLAEVTTTTATVANPHNVNTTGFIKAITPVSANPSSGVDSFDTTTFYNVDPGTTVLFEVHFYNDIFQPTTAEVTLFEATINVVGEGTLLDTRQVYIIVPGRADSGFE